MESNAESEWWLPESGLDPEKIDLKIEGKTAKSIKNLYYLARYLPVLFTLTSIIGIIACLLITIVPLAIWGQAR